MQPHEADDMMGKPWLRLKVTCENCELAVDAPLVVKPDSTHYLEIGPLKVMTATMSGRLLFWAILCTECIPSFGKYLRQRYPDDTIRVTEVHAKDAGRARQLLENSLKL